jgi:hypothetical protein
VDSLHNRFGNSQSVIPPLAARGVVADDQDSRLFLKYSPDYLTAEIPGCGYFGHAEVALLETCEWAFLRFVRSRTA